VLNYKRIPYKTVWLSYPDIEPTLKQLGASPKSIDPEGNPHYMLPAILDTSGKAPVLVTDSLNIAEYLDATYPDRPVFPREGRALQYAFEETFNRIVGPHFWRMMLPLAWGILDERSRGHVHEKRERWHKSRASLGQWRPEASITGKDWESLKGGFDKLAAFLNKNSPEMLYVAGGAEPTRADMIIVSYLASIVVAAPEMWNREVRHWSGGRWERLWKASESWRVVH
jgi:glutathione S-transferase